MKKVVFYLFVIFAVTTNAMSINENSILENKHVLEGQDSIFMPVATDTMRVLTLPKEFLKRITPLDMDKEFPKIKNKKKAHEFIRNLERERVWIIDRRYMTDTTVSLVETIIEKVPIGF